MTETINWSVCRIVCWGLAVLGGLAMLIGMSSAAGVFLGIILGVVTVAVLGFLFQKLVCVDEPENSASMLEMGRGALEKAKHASGVVARTEAATIGEKTGQAMASARETVSDVAGAAREKVAETADSAKASVSEAAASTKETVSDAAATAGQKLAEAAGTADPTAASKESKPKPAETRPASAAPKYDESEIIEGTDEGTKPQVLSGPQDGKADDLKMIKGVGPKLEGVLHSVGFYHFKQIASWTEAEVAWVDANLKGFKGRVSRDGWVEQAKTLAAGGETEFSKRVEDGGVY